MNVQMSLVSPRHYSLLYLCYHLNKDEAALETNYVALSIRTDIVLHSETQTFVCTLTIHDKDASA